MWDMRPQKSPSHVYLTLVGALALGAFAACAPQRPASTTVTSGNLAPVAEREAEPPAADVPDGELVCRSKSTSEGTSELYLDWKAPGGARGTLRRIAPSG